MTQRCPACGRPLPRGARRPLPLYTQPPPAHGAHTAAAGAPQWHAARPMALPRGVTYDRRASDKPYLARYQRDKVKWSKWCATIEDANAWLIIMRHNYPPLNRKTKS